VAELYTFSFDFHPLKGDREGQYSLTVLGRWRLILTVEGDDAVVIEEVSNHYGN
jgi:plasmid maintenance system killer protein